jgi:hypothetical protein
LASAEARQDDERDAAVSKRLDDRQRGLVPQGNVEDCGIARGIFQLDQRFRNGRAWAKHLETGMV